MHLHRHTGSFPDHFPLLKQVRWLSPATSRKSYIQKYFTTEPIVVLVNILLPYCGVPGSGHFLATFAAIIRAGKKKKKKYY